MDRFQAAKIFLTIAETGSFTATAERLELSKAMVSRAVVELETWFNARLLQRTTRRVSLTDAGEQALDYCRQIANVEEEVMQFSAGRGGELSGTLRIATDPTFGRTVLLQMVQRFMALHPKLHIQLQLSDKAVDLIEERVDLAVRFTNRPEQGVVARHLADCYSLLVATPAYLAQGAPITPQQLVHFRCLAHTNLNRRGWKFYRDKQETVIELTPPLVINDVQALLNAVLADAGIAMLPTYLLTPYLAEQRLQAVLTDWELPVYSIYALYPSRHRLPLSVRYFLDFLLEEMKGKVW